MSPPATTTGDYLLFGVPGLGQFAARCRLVSNVLRDSVMWGNGTGGPIDYVFQETRQESDSTRTVTSGYEAGPGAVVSSEVDDYGLSPAVVTTGQLSSPSGLRLPRW